jgi:hypothetical protein
MSPTDRPLDSSSSRRRPLRVSSALLVIVILVLGSALILEQRREVRLREALAAYKHRSEGQITTAISGWLPVDLVWPEGTPLEVAIDRIKSASIHEVHRLPPHTLFRTQTSRVKKAIQTATANEAVTTEFTGETFHNVSKTMRTRL